MPSIKKTFSTGKMNKDVDERLVPNGQYRDAENIQVRTSSGDSDGVGEHGSVQNIKGNTIVESTSEGQIGGQLLYTTGYDNTKAKILASVEDEKTDKAYFLIAGPDPSNTQLSSVTSEKIFHNLIVELDAASSNETINPVVTDVHTSFCTWDLAFGSPSLNESIFQPPDGWGEPYNQIACTNTVTVFIGGIIEISKSNGEVLLRSKVQNAVSGVLGQTITIYDTYDINLEIEAGMDEAAGGGLVIKCYRDSVLKFHQYRKTITGINVIDNLLFWTDNNTEPKKINIDRCKAGTPSFKIHTKLMLEDASTGDLSEFRDLEYVLSPDVNNDLKEEHITVMRQAPKTAPTLEMSSTSRNTDTTLSGVSVNFTGSNSQMSSDSPKPGEEIIISDTQFIDIDYRINDILEFSEMISEPGKITCVIDNIVSTQGSISLSLTILSVIGIIIPPNTDIDGSGLWVVKLQQSKPLFELKLGRFAYRYKYEDGEYSSFSPWSELAFLPGRFDYSHKKGYNLGMVNNLRQLTIKDFIPYIRSRPNDVAEVDILYKRANEPNVYIVKSIKRKKDPEWDLFTPSELNPNYMFGKFNISSEMIYKALPSNQTLRSWDNVPRRALAQEITGNRLLFANYIQGYNITNSVGLGQSIKTNLSADIESPKKSIKTLRKYTFGLVFGDKHGRETPVINPSFLDITNPNDYISTSNDVDVAKLFAQNQNKFELTQSWESPTETIGVPEQWMDYVKYYVKETSNEYYNLIMDRWYDAEDGNIWLSFNSADRNKIDDDTYLILKNEHGTDTPVQEKARYKIIAIENEAPDDVKLDERLMGKIDLSGSNEYMFLADDGDPQTDSPLKLMEAKDLKIPSGTWDGFLTSYKPREKGDLKMRIIAGIDVNGDGSFDGLVRKTKWVNVTHYKNKKQGETEGSARIYWAKAFGEGVDMYDKFVAAGYGSTVTGLRYYMEFKEDVVDSKPEFDGKFFVKIQKDDILQSKVLITSGGENADYDNIATFKIMYIDTQAENPAITGPRSRYRWANTSGDTVTEDGVTYNIGAATNGAEQDWNNNGNGNGNNNLTNISDITLQDQTVINEYTNGVGVSQSGIQDEDDVPYFALGCAGSDGLGNYTVDGEWVANRADETKEYWRWYWENSRPVANTWLFIDGARARYMWQGNAYQPPQVTNDVNDDGDEVRSANYYKPTAIDKGYLVDETLGVNETVEGDLGRIQFGITVMEGFNHDSNTSRFYDYFRTYGTEFIFSEDPDNNVYRVVSQGDSIDDFHAANYNQVELATISVINESQQFLGANWYGGSNLLGNTDPDFFNTSGFNNWLNEQIDDTSVYNIFSNQNVGDNCGGRCTGGFMNFLGEQQTCYRQGLRVEFRLVDKTTGNLAENGTRGIDPTIFDPRGQVCHDGREAMAIQIVAKARVDEEKVIPVANAACWETEPKEDVGLDIYYEASSAIPMILNSENTPRFAPYNSNVSLKVWNVTDEGFMNKGIEPFWNDLRVSYIGYTTNSSIIHVSGNKLPGMSISNIGQGMNWGSLFNQQGGNAIITSYNEVGSICLGDFLVFTHPNGTQTMSKVTRYMAPVDPNFMIEEEEATMPDPLKETVFEPVESYNGTLQVQDMDQWVGGMGPTPIIVLNPGGGWSVSVGMIVSGDNVPSGVYVTGQSEMFPGVIQLSDTSWMEPPATINNPNPSLIDAIGTDPFSVSFSGQPTGFYEIDSNVYKYPITLGWHNCWSFGNGVESDRIRDDFNAPQLDNGVKVSTTFLEYGEENISSGLIYSGLYNSTSSVNDLNEFNMAEKITKTLNPSYGSIQALKTRNTDVITFCEDKVLKVLSNKDALYNADGNPQLTATNRVLGTAIPFAGDYGISSNPESLAGDQYRLYFSDKQRGSVLRLSMDGMTPISSVGMKTWFDVNLRNKDTLLGSFDKVSGEYNISVGNKTISFHEESKGWVSFKSFVPQSALSISGKYFSAIDDSIWKHYSNNVHGSFYNANYPASITTVFNDAPDVVKSFKAIGYEGSRAKVEKLLNQNPNGIGGTHTWNSEDSISESIFYNLNDKYGWYVSSFKTDLDERAEVREFKNKEGKWFNKISGKIDFSASNLNTGEFSVQGLGNIYSESLVEADPEYVEFNIDGDNEND